MRGIAIALIVFCLLFQTTLGQSPDEERDARLKSKLKSREYMSDHVGKSAKDRYHENLGRDMHGTDQEAAMRAHRHRHDHHHHDSEDFREERHKKFLDMNRRRGDRFTRQVKEANFPPDKELEMLNMIERYHDLEFEQAEHNHHNRQSMRDAYGAMSKSAREIHREKERAERFAIRDMRLEIEALIKEQMANNAEL